MKKQQARNFSKAVVSTFGFLVTEHHFTAPCVEAEPETQRTFVTYKGESIAIEFVLDQITGDVSCNVRMAEDPPDELMAFHGYFSKYGPMDLDEMAFYTKGVTPPPIAPASPDGEMYARLQAYAHTLRHVLPEVLQDDVSILS